jgi:hypothetical protein
MIRIIKIIIILLTITVVVGGIAILVLRRRQAPSVTTPQEVATLVQEARSGSASAPPAPAAPSSPANAPSAPAHAVIPAAPADPAVQLQSDLRRIAKNFAERWGTSSSAYDASPPASLLPFMTVRMRAFAASLPPQEARDDLYHTLQTRALNVEETLFDIDAGTAAYEVATQRVERQGGAGNQRVFYQDLEVRMRKEDGLWKVDGAFWRPVGAD